MRTALTLVLLLAPLPSPKPEAVSRTKVEKPTAGLPAVPQWKACGRCDGTGVIVHSYSNWGKVHYWSAVCPDCAGTGDPDQGDPGIPAGD